MDWLRWPCYIQSTVPRLDTRSIHHANTPPPRRTRPLRSKHIHGAKPDHPPRRRRVARPNKEKVAHQALRLRRRRVLPPPRRRCVAPLSHPTKTILKRFLTLTAFQAAASKPLALNLLLQPAPASSSAASSSSSSSSAASSPSPCTSTSPCIRFLQLVLRAALCPGANTLLPYTQRACWL